ncbi:MAG: M24 family metallopeptidase [Christensenellales bacterium]|jgi:Xaa-Pro aminopeptidase
MAINEIDVLIAFGHNAEPQYVRYFSDFQPVFETAGIAIPCQESASLLVGPESYERALAHSKLRSVKRMIAFRESSAPKYEDNTFHSFSQLLNQYNQVKPIKKLGIVGWVFIPREVSDEIRSSLGVVAPHAEIIPADDIVDSLRAEKSIAEISCLKEAARISRAAFEHVLKNIKVGMTCEELKGFALEKMYMEGAEGEAFPAWITCDTDTEYAISSSSKMIIRKGSIVQIQLGARYEGYASAIGRAVIMGEPTQAQKHIIDSCIKAKTIVENAINDNYGKPARLVAEAHRHEIEKQGNLHMLVYGPCHSVGLVECENPWIEMGSEYILKENMVFCIDVFLRDPKNNIGVRYEDMVLIRENEIEKLTNFPNTLITIPVEE